MQQQQHDRTAATQAYTGREASNTPDLDMNAWKGWVRLVGCYDGDTITVIVRFLGEFFKVHVRVSGIDAPELRGVSHDRGMEARDCLIAHLTGCDCKGMTTRQVREILHGNVYLVWLNCGKNDKYGRVLCDVYSEPDCADTNAATAMLGAGLARPYFGGKR